MIKKTLYILCYFIGLYLNAQQEFHVFPIDDLVSPGTTLGNGSLTQPWDLQTALNQKTNVVDSGDTIWIHEGIYNGRFVSTLQSLEPNQYITVAGFKEDKVILNGNVDSKRNTVLEVKGKQIIYKNFDITCLGNFSRNGEDEDFERINGLNHTSGVDCMFINLNIHDNPGLGVGSWKSTGGTIFNGCMIFNNGYILKGKGIGEGVYTQNLSNKTRVFENCIIFNNYYKGIEVWSANRRATEEYVKNFTLKNNVIFNSGSPVDHFKDNLIVATGDRNAINIAKNIKILNNVFYHNTNIAASQINGDAASLTLGFHKNAPVENVEVKDNIIIGRNNALRILHAKSLTFENNISYCGYVHFAPSVLEHINNWTFTNNKYFTKKASSFRITNDKDYTIAKWKSTYNLDIDSDWQHIKKFDLSKAVNIKKFDYRNNTYKVVAFQKNGDSVIGDFSKEDLINGMTYKIYDVENLNTVLKLGTLPEDGHIIFPMNTTNFQKPLHNTKAQKTLSNFGVFIIEFENNIPSEISTEKKDNAFKRFLKWLGF